MPCYATGSAEGDARLAASEAHRRLTEVTDMLCSVMQTIERERNGLDFIDTKLKTNVQNWWAEHKRIDAEKQAKAREEQNRRILAEQALKKLTKEELEALGYKKI